MMKGRPETKYKLLKALQYRPQDSYRKIKDEELQENRLFLSELREESIKVSRFKKERELHHVEEECEVSDEALRCKLKGFEKTRRKLDDDQEALRLHIQTCERLVKDADMRRDFSVDKLTRDIRRTEEFDEKIKLMSRQISEMHQNIQQQKKKNIKLMRYKEFLDDARHSFARQTGDINCSQQQFLNKMESLLLHEKQLLSAKDSLQGEIGERGEEILKQQHQKEMEIIELTSRQDRLRNLLSLEFSNHQNLNNSYERDQNLLHQKFQNSTLIELNVEEIFRKALDSISSVECRHKLFLSSRNDLLAKISMISDRLIDMQIILTSLAVFSAKKKEGREKVERAETALPIYEFHQNLFSSLEFVPQKPSIQIASPSDTPLKY